MQEPHSDYQSLQIERKKRNAASLVFRYVAEGMTPAEAWYSVFPNSKANENTATKECHRYMKWFRENWPIEMRQLLCLHDYDDDRIIELISEMLSATIPLKVGVKKWKDDDGVAHEEIQYKQVRDWRTFDAGVQKLMVLAGHTAHGGPAGKISGGTDGAANSGVQPVRIGTRKKLPDDEWQTNGRRSTRNISRRATHRSGHRSCLMTLSGASKRPRRPRRHRIRRSTPTDTRTA